MKITFQLASITLWTFFWNNLNDRERVKADDCRNIHFVNRVQNKILQGNALKTVQANNFDTCQLKCYGHDDCVSINFASNGTCHLNSFDHAQKPQDFVESPDSMYSSIENPCVSSPCQYNDTACQVGFTDLGYRCKCLKKGYFNERCEKVFIPIYVKSVTKTDCCGMQGSTIIKVNGTNYSKTLSRGHNIVTVFPNGSIHASEGFDTYGSLQAVRDMKAFIDSLPDNLIVLMAVHDSSRPDLFNQVAGAKNALYRLGAVPPALPLIRESWLLVGYNGPEKPAWVQQRHALRNMGPVNVTTEVVL